MFRLNSAISRYNEKFRGDDEPKMTQRRLGKIVLPGKSEKNSENYMYRLANGKTPTVNVDVVKEICDSLQVDANYLFGIN